MAPSLPGGGAPVLSTSVVWLSGLQASRTQASHPHWLIHVGRGLLSFISVLSAWKLFYEYWSHKVPLPALRDLRPHPSNTVESCIMKTLPGHFPCSRCHRRFSQEPRCQAMGVVQPLSVKPRGRLSARLPNISSNKSIFRDSSFWAPP